MKPICLAAAILIMLAAPAPAQVDPLPSWNDGPSKRSILDFVGKVTKEGSPDYVNPAERIATFDNDGTLWAEQPMYFQFLFVVDRIRALADEHPDWRTKEPYRSVLAGDMKAVAASGEKGAVELLAAIHTGMTVDEFADDVRSWMQSAGPSDFETAIITGSGRRLALLVHHTDAEREWAYDRDSQTVLE